MNKRRPPMQDAALIDALHQATSLELYQLGALVERLSSDPRRIIAIRRDLHLGQIVRFYDARRDVMREGRIVDMHDAQLTLNGTQEARQWKLPYAAIEPPAPGAVRPPASQPSPSPAPPKPTRADFTRGDKVSFTDRHLNPHLGTLTRCNPKTATVDAEGGSWSVPYAMLSHVIEI